MLEAYMKWNHFIKEEDLLRVLREAAAHGYQALVIINGEYYDIALDDDNIPSVDSAASADLPF